MQGVIFYQFYEGDRVTSMFNDIYSLEVFFCFLLISIFHVIYCLDWFDDCLICCVFAVIEGIILHYHCLCGLFDEMKKRLEIFLGCCFAMKNTTLELAMGMLNLYPKGYCAIRKFMDDHCELLSCEAFLTDHG
ncbi:hypothetical protein ACJX0J_038364 [Zea mays]